MAEADVIHPEAAPEIKVEVKKLKREITLLPLFGLCISPCAAALLASSRWLAIPDQCWLSYWSC